MHALPLAHSSPYIAKLSVTCGHVGIMQVLDFEDRRAAARKKWQEHSPDVKHRIQASDLDVAKENIPSADAAAVGFQEVSRKYATLEMKVGRHGNMTIDTFALSKLT